MDDKERECERDRVREREREREREKKTNIKSKVVHTARNCFLNRGAELFISLRLKGTFVFQKPNSKWILGKDKKMKKVNFLGSIKT